MKVDLDNNVVSSEVRVEISQLSKKSRFQFISLLREQSETCEVEDGEYLDFLYDILGESVEESEKDKDLYRKGFSDNDLNGDDHVGNSAENFENEDSDDADPQYKMFLSHVKGNGKSFTFKMKDENGYLKIMEYQKEVPIDTWLNLKKKRNMNNVVENRRKRSRSEPKKSKNVKRSCLGSFSGEKSKINIPSRKHTSRNQSVSHLQPKSDKDGLGKMGEDRWEPPNLEKVIIKNEQESLVEEDYQRFLSSAEVVANGVNLTLKGDGKIVYDGQVDLDNVFSHEVKSARPGSPDKNNVEEDDSCQILDRPDVDQLKEKVMAILRKPFDYQEYNTLWDLVTQKRNIELRKDLRYGRDRSVPTLFKGKSYLEQHEACGMGMHFQTMGRCCMSCGDAGISLEVFHYGWHSSFTTEIFPRLFWFFEVPSSRFIVFYY